MTTDSPSPPAATGDATPHVPTGNTTDKYNLDNPAARRLVENFQAAMWQLFDRIEPASVLDVGCGEGVLTEEMADRVSGTVTGVDFDDPKLRAEWEARQRPNLDYQTIKAERLPFDDDAYDVATAIEVLEHVDDPAAVLGHMRRIAKRYLLVSVPREPIWRAVNMARGSYLRDWGNTPGHLNHWSKRSFVRLLSDYGHVEAVRSPFPWTMALVRV